MLCRDGRALIRRRHNPQPKSGLTLYEPTPMGRTNRRTTPEGVPEFRCRMRNTLRTNRCAGTYPNLTPTSVSMFRCDTCGRYRHTPTSYTPDSRQCQPPTGDCADLEISENFVIFM